MDSVRRDTLVPDIEASAVRSVMAQMEVREPAFRSRSGSIKVLLPSPGGFFSTARSSGSPRGDIG